CATALVDAGAQSEGALLEIAEEAATATAEAALSVLAECGGPTSVEPLRAIARRRRALASSARTALAQSDARAPPGAPAARAAGRGAQAAEAADGAVSARLVLFGPPRIELGTRVLPASAWRAQRAFHVLILLALRPRGASRDELLETFWPGRQLAAGRRNFHPTLSYIRSVLPRHTAPPLLRDAELYRPHPEYPLSRGAWEFEARLDA